MPITRSTILNQALAIQFLLIWQRVYLHRILVQATLFLLFFLFPRFGNPRRKKRLPAISSAENTLSAVLFKAQLWEKINQQPVNERQRLIINRMLEDDFKGHMNTSKYAKLAKCSTGTALRDIQNLKSRGIFIRNPGGGRGTSYRLLDTI